MLVNTCSSFNSSGVCTQVGNGDDQDYGANPATILSAGNTVTNNTLKDVGLLVMTMATMVEQSSSMVLVPTTTLLRTTLSQTVLDSLR